MKGTLLLERFLPHNPALAGDLEEEHRRRGSALWYWRQVSGAIVLGLASDIHAHAVLVIRAIAAGWTAMWLFSFIASEINAFMSGWVLDRLIMTFWSHPFPMMWATQLWFRPAMALSFLTSGWIVGRLHRTCQPAMVVAFMLTVLGWTLYRTTLTFMAPPLTPVPYPIFIVLFTPMPLLIVAGGLWNSRADRVVECQT